MVGGSSEKILGRLSRIWRNKKVLGKLQNVRLELCIQGVIRYHPALPRKEGREKRKKMAVLEINDWDDSVTSCLCGKKGERTGKKSVLKKKRLIRPPTPPDTLKSLINSRTEPKVDD